MVLGRLGGKKSSRVKKKTSRQNGSLGGRPSRTLTSFTAAKYALLQDWKYSFFEFVDDFRQKPSIKLVERDPLPLNLDPKLYALLQSICISLCNEAHIKPTGWLLKNLFLPSPWFVSGCKNLYATAIQESPVAFRKNNIFVLGNFMNRL